VHDGSPQERGREATRQSRMPWRRSGSVRTSASTSPAPKNRVEAADLLRAADHDQLSRPLTIARARHAIVARPRFVALGLDNCFLS
jgi:hypothetical protein